MELGRKIGEKTHLCTQNIRIYPKTALMMVFKVFLNKREQKKKTNKKKLSVLTMIKKIVKYFSFMFVDCCVILTVTTRGH